MADTQYQVMMQQYDMTLMHLYELTPPFLINHMAGIGQFNKGKNHYFGNIGRLTGQKKTGRNEKVKLVEPEFNGRHLITDTFYVATPLDAEDVGKMVTDPTNDLYTECVNEIGRLQTVEAMESFFRDVITGEDGGSTSAYPGANTIAVNFSTGVFGQNSGAADVGLNLDKLMKMRSMISNKSILVNTNPNNTLNIAVCEDDIQSLISGKIGTDNYTMIDQFSALQVGFEKASTGITTGGSFQWHGFTFHILPPEYFVLNGSGHRRLPVWVKDGMVFGLKEPIRSKIAELPDTVESTKIQVLTRCGGLRKHDSKVFDILVKV